MLTVRYRERETSSPALQQEQQEPPPGLRRGRTVRQHKAA
jgi:hypothetical protein